MKNLRLDSLPPDRQVAALDCPTCVKRRIKCDRTLPNCFKCRIRNLKCPGFQPFQLKWNQGIASRGKFAGKPAPILRQEASKGDENKPWNKPDTDGAAAATCNSSSSQNAIESRSPSDVDDEFSKPSTAIVSPLSPFQDQDLINGYLSTTLSDNLIRHFYASVVPRLTWIDVPENPWRNIALPLAQNSRCIRMSVSSLAAAHLSITSTNATDQKARFIQVYTWLRDATLRALSHKIRNSFDSDGRSVRVRDGATNSSGTEILAAMLVLCYAEAFVPGSRDWALHLRACRTVIEYHDLRNRRIITGNSIEKFLLKEVADLETLSNISVFTEDSCLMTAVPNQSIYDGSFWTFTGLVSEITAMERKRYDMIRNHKGVSAMDMGIWHTRADQAYAGVWAGLESFPEHHREAKPYFEAVIRTHYHASLIYSYQSFATPAEVKQIVESLLDLLCWDFQLVAAGPSHPFTHDLFFPLFIAGTECRGDVYRQSIIENIFLESLSETGIWCNHTSLQFLQTFWRSSTDAGGTWIQYARENETQNGTFIVF